MGEPGSTSWDGAEYPGPAESKATLSSGGGSTRVSWTVSGLLAVDTYMRDVSQQISTRGLMGTFSYSLKGLYWGPPPPTQDPAVCMAMTLPVSKEGASQRK